jgi:hypothetical protein
MCQSQHTKRLANSPLKWYSSAIMPNRSSRHKQGPEDTNEAAFRVMQEAVGEKEPALAPEKNLAAVELGRLGGMVGGHARAAALSPERRSEIARQAASARWAAGQKRIDETTPPTDSKT